MRMRGERGFTLLEMLVALTVFAVVSAMVYGGQMAVLRLKEGTERQAELLKQLQMTVTMLERDIGQHLPREVRDEFGDRQPAMVSAQFGAYRLLLTHAGWQNPLLLPRSSLQRVGYGVEEESLVRYSWPTLDRAHGSEPDRLLLLPAVSALGFRFLDEKNEWQEQWPPQAAAAGAVVAMPRAVEVVIELREWGTLRRVIPTAGG